MIIRKRPYTKPLIDLTGPDGNAFSLLSRVRVLGRAVGFDDDKIDAIRADMKSGDYKNLVKVFHDNFGTVVDLYWPEGFDE